MKGRLYRINIASPSRLHSERASNSVQRSSASEDYAFKLGKWSVHGGPFV
jgi:hypothetical protein